MGWRYAAILTVLAVTLLGGTVLAPLLILPAAVPMLAPILPRPDGVLPVASAEYDFKSGTTWRWERPIVGGCLAWMAERDWADVVVSTDASNCRNGPGVGYFTSSDELVFRGYWPRPAAYGGEPCPVALSPAQIARLRELIRTADMASFTAAERAVLRRIDERLAAVDGAALTTDASGWCNDLKPEDYKRPRTDNAEVWG